MGSITCSPVELNTGAAYDGATFTAPRQGHSRFYASAQSITGATRLAIQRNGATVAARYTEPVEGSMNVEATASLAAGDAITAALLLGTIFAGDSPDGFTSGRHWLA
eukprot:6699211-Alexandrium_andersonii.AAC.1